MKDYESFWEDFFESIEFTCPEGTSRGIYENVGTRNRVL